MTTKPRVIMVGPDLTAHGGMTAVVKEYISAGIEEACHFRYIPTTSNGGIVSKIAKAAAAYIKFILALKHYDIVHVHLGAGISVARKKFFIAKAKRAGKKIVLHEHRGILKDEFFERGEHFQKKTVQLFAECDSVIVLSEEWRNFFAENICDRGKCKVLHNSVSCPSDIGFGNREESIVFLGHFTEVKGPDVLINAIPEVVETHPEATFYFAGDGDIQKYIEFAEDKKVSDRCDFLGWIDSEQKDDLLRRAAIYCQPSRNEGMPMGLLEAMSYGLAPVATRVGGVSQVMIGDLSDFLVDAEDHSGIADRIVKYLDDTDMRIRLGMASRGIILSQFNAKSNLMQLLGIYADLD